VAKINRRDLFKRGAAGAAALIGASMTRGALAAPDKDESLPQVPRKVLGKTGKKIPILLMGGAMKLDPRFDPKLAEALRFGVNYIDAADCYSGGTCEPAVASFHKRLKVRDKLWITSKSDDHDPEGFEKTVNQSLKKLETDYIDLYYLHNLDDIKYLNAKLEKVVSRLIKAGKIRHFGFSCHEANVPELLEFAANVPWVESIMFRYNFRQYGDKKLNAAIDKAHAAKIGLIAMKTQGSEAGIRNAWEKFEKTGKWTKHQAVLKAVWNDPRITAAVSHMDTLEKLRENIAAALDRSKLGANEVEALERYARATRSLACDGCDWHCNPAVQDDVRIGDTMRYLMYHEVYGEQDKARELFGKLPERARRLDVIDFEPANRACPNGVDVVAHMQRAHELLNG
jgi:predicted aldo/keto reductase-like oxidoreductase